MNLFPPNKNVSSAEEVRYYCARRYLDSERCDEWYVWMRYGQYLVELDADALCSGDGSESHAEGESGNSRVVVRAGRAC
ncbi:hypothetical protein [Haloactinomyces albus]|uniref:Uncharacterized protein n=1 Tax=Haloactinomyces albus TaxID=1352928 RepID=A0AAE4CLJ9_9ACTN|nr:hypothetical protein [Haloactinomyces albus]MDR7301914.1 hypothetical protein [Haloactinomyces albus]